MRIKYHYCIEGDDVILRKFFKGFSVNYQIYKRKEGENIYLFDLYEDQRAYDKFKLYFPVLSRTNSVRIIEYSKKEIEDSEWLIVESMIQKVSWKYDENSFEKSCPYKKMFIKAPYYRHYEQRNLLTAEKTVKWGNRHFFYAPDTADDFIFCSDRTKNILGEKWNGLEFWPVKKNNTTQNMPDLYQLYFAENIPINAISGGKLVTCKMCGRKMVCLKNGIEEIGLDMSQLKSSCQVYKTGNILTSDIRKNTFSLNIVSQEFYQYCEKYQMNRGMLYRPVKRI